MICSPIIETEIDAMTALANRADADLVELRLDYLKDYSTLEKIREVNKPKIITCMPEWEGGLFKGSESERARVILDSLEFCDSSDYVSIELKTGKENLNKILTAAKKKKIRVIISSHNFRETPEKKEILKILSEEEKAGADIAKVAFMPKNHRDVLTVLFALTDNNLKIPVVAISMGELGKITRVAGLLMGSYLTFASLKKGRESAKGQMSVKEVREALKFFK